MHEWVSNLSNSLFCVQVAEMHGELLEFNESLQKSVQSRDAAISRLRAELVLLRGPLPEDQVLIRISAGKGELQNFLIIT